MHLARREGRDRHGGPAQRAVAVGGVWRESDGMLGCFEAPTLSNLAQQLHQGGAAGDRGGDTRSVRGCGRTGEEERSVWGCGGGRADWKYLLGTVKVADSFPGSSTLTSTSSTVCRDETISSSVLTLPTPVTPATHLLLFRLGHRHVVKSGCNGIAQLLGSRDALESKAVRLCGASLLPLDKRVPHAMAEASL